MHEGGRKRKRTWIGGLLIFGAFASFMLLCLLVAVWGLFEGSPYAFDLSVSNKIAVLEIEGPIYSATEILDQLDLLCQRSRIKAIVLRLESPGGSVAAAQEVHRELMKIRSAGAPVVVASMGNVAASGAYYIACAADLIMASPGSLTGSIGVIASWTQYGELLDWAKLKPVIIKSGRFKDAGNPAREMKPEELAYHQELVDELHRQFVEAVAESRGIPEERVRELGNGKVFSGEQAVDLSLIDEIGNLNDAIERAAELAGLSGHPKVVKLEKERPLQLLDLLQGMVRDYLGFSGGGLKVPREPGYQYLWIPPEHL